MQCVLFWKVTLVETTLLTSKQLDIVSRGFICTYLRCMKYLFSWCMKYFLLVLREIQRRLEGSWEVPHSRPSHLCSYLSVVACLLALIWSTMGNHTSLQAPSWKAGKLFQKLTKLDQIHCAWLITWVVKRETIQLAELCLTRWWILSGIWWYWVSIWWYWLVFCQYKLVMLGIR